MSTIPSNVTSFNRDPAFNAALMFPSQIYLYFSLKMLKDFIRKSRTIVRLLSYLFYVILLYCNFTVTAATANENNFLEEVKKDASI